MNKEYPSWVCFSCGEKYGRGVNDDHICTVHLGTCGVCGENTSVTEPRDFGHLDDDYKNHKRFITLEELHKIDAELKLGYKEEELC